ncbi:hypothetical protein C1H46_006370 [Malus baccata]|uniref:Hemerythrin-like domain-containing protein n=1 Tax=Malus baccata TaxID=106549 RepID=A0A540NAM0_MALBA|nr:hypothetical protein C1H46_006370 [Malus baccata]
MFCKRGRRGQSDSPQHVMVGLEAGLEHEYAGVEVQRRRRAQLRCGPLDLFRALLAVPDLVLQRVAPSFLVETVPDCVEMSIWQVKEVVYIVVHLNVPVQITALALEEGTVSSRVRPTTPFWMCELPRKVESSSVNGCLVSTEEPTMRPILIFLFLHKAIRKELDALHRLAMTFAIGKRTDIRPPLEHYHFLRSIYKHHFNAEDEVIFPTLDIRVKNVARTYSLEHKGETNLFDHLFELLSSNAKNDENFPRELASRTNAIQTSVSQHLAKEEEQVLPLLIEKVLVEEQATLVWQFLCSIPVTMMAEFLPWLSLSVSPDEHQDLRKCLRKSIPEKKLVKRQKAKVVEKKLVKRPKAKAEE